MIDDPCYHLWGEAELCETRLGNIMSPTCRHCGAVKIVEQQRAARANVPVREDLAPFLNHKEGPCHEVIATPRGLVPTGRIYADEPVALIPTNIPPAAAPAVHPFQTEFFPNA